MALLTDPHILSADDLAAYEASVISVAATHNIDIPKKITAATEEVSDKVFRWLLRMNAAASPLTAPDVSTVVLTPVLRRWLIFESLTLIFGDAYNSQLNDRFQGKFSEYLAKASAAEEGVQGIGIGVVGAPLPKPSAPVVTTQAGTGPAGNYLVHASWVDRSGQESAIGESQTISIDAESTFAVSMGPAAVPTAAIGWNIYAGTASGTVTRQNAAVLAVNGTWTLPASGLISGSEPSDGQDPDFYLNALRRWQRG